MQFLQRAYPGASGKPWHAAMSTVDTAQVWAWLGEVPDPEIPVISVVDLGIVRDVALAATSACVVTITPDLFRLPGDAGDRRGRRPRRCTRTASSSVRIVSQLSPAWTTDWMSEAGKRQLKATASRRPRSR